MKSTTMWGLLVILSLCSVCHCVDNLLIGAIFSNEYMIEEKALKVAIERINNNRELLPNNKIEYITNFTGIISKYDSIQKVCYQLNQAVTAIIGPMSSSSVKASYPMCDGFQIPMITPSATDPTLSRRQFYRYLFRMMPSDVVQSAAIFDIVRYFRWDTLAILADNTDYGTQGLIVLQTAASENNIRVLSVQQFAVYDDVTSTNVTAQLRNIRGSGARVIILFGLAERAIVVLDQAHRLGMVTSGWVWIVTDGVCGDDKLPRLVRKRSYLKGILGTRPAVDSDIIQEFYRDLLNITNMPAPSVWPLLFHDAVYVYAHAMHQLLEREAYIIRTEPHDCLASDIHVWRQGPILYKHLTEVKARGVSGVLEFTKDGAPVNGVYDVVSLEDDRWVPYGRWSERDGLSLNASGLRTVGDELLYNIRDYVGDLANKTLRVVTVVDPPFVFKSNHSSPSDRCNANACFHGYAIDLLSELSSVLNFEFVIREVEDKKYGGLEETTNTWNGIIAELIRNEYGQTKADLGVGAITITSERQSVVSFTKPYRDLQRGILIASQDETFNPLSFLTPLTYDLWALTFGTAFVVGVFITCVDKMSPYGHHGKKAQIDNEYAQDAMDTNEDGSVDYWELKDWHTERNTMNFCNALLWCLASLFQQGGERHPKSWSARIAAGAWWFGILIITSSYTANLAAFLTIKRPAHDVQSLEDLLNTPHVRYGTVADSEVQQFFESVNQRPYTDIRRKMNEWGLYFKSAAEAVEYTMKSKGKFAFLYDLPSIEYWKGQHCDLKVSKYGFGNIGYGFVLPKNSPYTKELTIAIYKLREAGYMDSLHEKWMSGSSKCETTASEDPEKSTVTIGMDSVWGVFWLVYTGFAISLALALMEWLYSALSAVNPDDNEAPHSFVESIQMRLVSFKKDVAENWFLNFHRAETKRHERQIRPLTSTVRAAVMLKIRAARMSNHRRTHKPDHARMDSYGNVSEAFGTDPDMDRAADASVNNTKGYSNQNITDNHLGFDADVIW